MRTRMVCLCFLMAVVALVGSAAMAAAPSEALRVAYEAALAAPNDEARLNALLAVLPAVETPEGVRSYIVEGDLLFTASEVRQHLEAHAAAGRSDQRTPELLVNLHGGAQDYWRTTAERQLTYAVDRRSFPSATLYETVVANTAAAAKDWEQLCPDCGITIRHAPHFDAAPTQASVTFIVRYIDVHGTFIAAAFFPHAAPHRRFVNIDPSYFTTDADKIGVLRHELGHVLGYRHEHIRGVAGCAREGRDWLPLTPYDPHSVMHYFCGGGGDVNLQFTEVDRDGHRRLYRPQQGSLPVEAGTAAATPDSALQPAGDLRLVVRFEGGDVSVNLAKVLRILVAENLVQGALYKVQPGDSLCSIYRTQLKLPSEVRCSEELLGLARELNKDLRSLSALQPGQIIQVPEQQWLRTYRFSKRYDQKIEKDRRDLAQARAASPSLRDEQQQRPDMVKLGFDGYEIVYPVAEQKRAEQILKRIHAIDSANIYASVSANRPASRGLQSLEPATYVRRCQDGTLARGEEGDYALLIGHAAFPQCTQRCEGDSCSRIVLIDTVVHNHPNIHAAIEIKTESEAAGARRIADATGPCQEVPFRPREHHGTHLAGIMVSQRNGSGLIGLSPGSKLRSYELKKLSDAGLGDLIEQIMESPQMKPMRKIFVFASSFDRYPNYYLKNRQFALKDEKQRWSLLSPARAIERLLPLWITSIGQAEGPSEDGTPPRFPELVEPTEILKETPFSPVNLGDHRGLIVVTACDDCGDQTARLLPEAHYSIRDRLVHIAAPGRNIPGLADHTHLSWASGTSQAAAFVGGVAAAMANCYPQHYDDAAAVKVRLQVTARPVFTDDDAKKVQSGIVDPELALLDPTKHWLRQRGVALKPVEVVGWCTPDLLLKDAETGEALEDGYVETRLIYRITKYRRTVEGAPPRWVMFAKHGYDQANKHIAEARRVGPGAWAVGTPLLMLRDAGTTKVTAIDDIEDLLLSQPVRDMKRCQ